MKGSGIRWLIGIFLGLVLMYRFINKDSLIQVIDQSLPIVEGGILKAMILGDKSGLSKDFYKNLIDTGLIHLVIVSGSNVILIVGSLIGNFSKYIGRRKTIIISLFIAWNYAALVGFEAPVVRAVILVSIFYWAQLLGRKYDWKRSLGLTILLMILADWRLVKEVGFWLSFVAFLAVTLRNRNTNFKDEKFNYQIKQDFVTTLWVSLWITPILGLVFGKISLIGPISNTLVLFLVETITLVGGLGVLVGVVWPVLGQIIIWFIYPLLKYFDFVVRGFGSLSWDNLEIRFNLFIFLGWYLVLGYILLRRRNEN